MHQLEIMCKASQVNIMIEGMDCLGAKRDISYGLTI